jgi:hypothetical protein
MAMTFAELVRQLKEYDELTVLELLEISAEDIVERFQDRIEDKFDYLEEQISEAETETYSE